MVKQFVVKDIDTGLYFCDTAWWGSEEQNARRFSYMDACKFISDRSSSNWRIVEAPPKRLTDEECWEWLTAHPRCDLGFHPPVLRWCVYDGYARAYGDTPQDAIRAAASKCFEVTCGSR